MRFLLYAVCFAFLITSCLAERAAVSAVKTVVAPPPETTAAPETVHDADEDIKAARQRAVTAEHDAAVAHADLKTLTAQRDQLQIEAVRAKLLWVTWIGVLGVLAGVALFVLLPAGLKSRAIAIGAASAAVAAASLMLRDAVQYLPYLEWAGAILTLGGASWVLLHLKRTQSLSLDAHKALDVAVAYGSRVAQVASDAGFNKQVEEVKSRAALVADDLGVRPLIDSRLAVLKTGASPLAAA